MYLTRRGLWAIGLTLSAAALAFCRDSNAYFLLFCGVLLAAVAANRLRTAAPWRNEALTGLALVVIFVLSNASANAGGRWVYPLTNVLVTRILPDEKAVAQFQSLGMPVNRALRPRRPRRSYDSDPKLEPFRAWVSNHGKRAYVGFLTAHPAYTLRAPDFSSLLSGALEQYQANGMRGERTLFDAFWSRKRWLWHIGLIAMLCCAAVFLRLRSAPILLGVAYAALLFPHGVLIWHADSMEVPRHGAPVSLQLQLALLLLFVGVLDALLSHLRRRPQFRASAPERS
jgi:multidrug transporter EmrE-like cation transporter